MTPPVELWRPSLVASQPIFLDHAPVLWRHPAQQSVWQLAAASLRGFRRTLGDRGFTEIQTPKIVSGSTESGATVFAVDYFGKRAFLAQSPQFCKQMMVGGALAQRGEATAPYDSYLAIFRHVMPPHGGFAIGLERWTAQLVEAKNIRRTTRFPRDLHRIGP